MDALFADIPPAFTSIEPEEYVSTGHPAFDSMLHGGIPKARFTEYWGPEGTGKTTTALQQASYLADNGAIIYYLDYERGLTQRLCQSVANIQEHIINHKFLVLKPTTFTDFETIFYHYVLNTPEGHSGIYMFVDSVASIQLSDYADLEVEGTNIGKDSLAQTKLVKKYKNVCDANNISVIWLNQARNNIQIGGPPNPFAPKLKPTGGKAYDHYLDIRVAFSKGANFKDSNGNNIGHMLHVMCSKNKFRPAYEKYVIPFVWGHGLSIPRYLHETLKSNKLVVAPGGNYKIKLPEYKDMVFKGQKDYFEFLYLNQTDVFNTLNEMGLVSNV